MKITKLQLRRMIREERTRLREQPEDPMLSPEHGLDVPVPSGKEENLWADIEAGLEMVKVAISKMAKLSPAAAENAARYAAEIIHDVR